MSLKRFEYHHVSYLNIIMLCDYYSMSMLTYVSNTTTMTNMIQISNSLLVFEIFDAQVMPNILSTLEGAFGFSETMVFCGLVKNEKNLPGLAENIKGI